MILDTGGISRAYNLQLLFPLPLWAVVASVCGESSGQEILSN